MLVDRLGVTGPLVQLIPESWTEPFPTFRHLLMTSLDPIVRNPMKAFDEFTTIRREGPVVLAWSAAYWQG